jgi:hypothetical protein
VGQQATHQLAGHLDIVLLQVQVVVAGKHMRSRLTKPLCLFLAGRLHYG